MESPRQGTKRKQIRLDHVGFWTITNNHKKSCLVKILRWNAEAKARDKEKAEQAAAAAATAAAAGRAGNRWGGSDDEEVLSLSQSPYYSCLTRYRHLGLTNKW